MKSKVFITGGSGMLGQVLVKHFDDVVAPSQDEFDLLKQAPEFSPCDVIIHCAAMTVVDDCEKDQALCRRINVDGTARVVDLARRWNAQLFFISTPMVFSGRRGNYREHADQLLWLDQTGRGAIDRKIQSRDYHSGQSDRCSADRIVSQLHSMVCQCGQRKSFIRSVYGRAHQSGKHGDVGGDYLATQYG